MEEEKTLRTGTDTQAHIRNNFIKNTCLITTWTMGKF